MKILPVVKTNNNMLLLAERCKASWDYFHPDIPMYVVKEEDWKPYIDETYRVRNGYKEYSMMVGLGFALVKMYTEGYDLFIQLDADTVVTGRCDEILSGDYDIAVSNSVCDNYYNAGVWATRSVSFISEFFYSHLVSSIGDNHLFMSLVSHSRQLTKLKVVDDINVWYNERSREWWGELRLLNDELWTPDRRIKILHWAGGCELGQNKRMSCSLFSDEVKQWLNKITGGTTFTDYDGIEFGNFIKDYYKL